MIPSGVKLATGSMTVGNSSGMSQTESLALLPVVLNKFFWEVLKDVALQYAVPAAKVVLKTAGAVINIGKHELKLTRQEWNLLAKKLGKNADDVPGVTNALNQSLSAMQRLKHLDLDVDKARQLLKINMGLPELPGSRLGGKKRSGTVEALFEEKVSGTK